jgi:hypothetical protein
MAIECVLDGGDGESTQGGGVCKALAQHDISVSVMHIKG